MYTVYIMECADHSLYTGITTDLARRFAEHKDGSGARYTRAHGVRRIVYREDVSSRSAALKREHTIKELSRAEKLVLIRRSAKVRLPGSVRR